MSVITSILRLDLKGIGRDQVLALNASLSVVMMLVITTIGLFRADDPAWVRWFPGLLAVSLLTGPPSWGFLFGLLMVDEKDSGVRGALAVSPVSPEYMLLIRSVTSVLLMIGWPFVSVLVMNAAWHALPIAWWSWLPLIGVLALGAPLTALTVAAFAGNKVEAIALYKGINFVALMPLALLFVPTDAWWRWFFFLLPSTWGLEAFEALRAGRPIAGWLLGALMFHLVLLGAALRGYSRAVYKTS